MSDLHELPTQKIRFEVEDTGLGIAADKLEDIFEPFQQAHRHLPQIEGTGLGLAISQRILRLMGSAIHVRSIPEKGSTFWFDLELPYKPAPRSRQHTALRRIIGIQGKKPVVLLVDDNAEERRLLQDMLRPLGFTIIEALHEEDARQKANGMFPDVIVLNIGMPGLDEFDLIRQLRASDSHGPFPAARKRVIMAISASAFAQTRHDSLEAGCDEFLPKPIELDRLLERLHTHLSIEWVYDTEHVPEQEPTRDALEEALIPPSQDDLTRLYELASIGDISGILQQLQRIEEKDAEFQPFAARVSRFANAMQVSAIEAFVKKYLG